METNSSTAGIETVAGTVRLANGRTARARRSAVAGAPGVVRYADSAGRARTASDDVAATFAPLTVEAVEQAHGVALIEAAGQGVRILTQITVDQHDDAFGDRPWPTTERAQLHGSVDAIRVAVGGQWYDLTRVQMPSGERRRFARQYNGYGDGPADVREASMMFGCAWSSVPVVGWTEAEIEAAHEAAAEADDYAERVDILAEHEQELINAAADELRRIADDADREAAEQLAELGEWGHSPADILAEPDVDTSGCSNRWHRTAALYGRRACSECPPVFRPVETVELPPGVITVTPDPPHAAGAGPAVTTDRTDPLT